MAWTIKGEAGKTLDATARSLDALNISACTLQFQSLAGDTLQWTAATTDATGAGTIVPDIGQIVELFWNSTRKFKGHVTAPKVGMKQITVTVAGPWWWMERTNLTEVQTDANGGTAERASYVFPTQSLAASISALIARAMENGVPMTAGPVDAMFSVPHQTLSECHCGNALASLMAWCPDAVAWFDYSGTTPALNITRRGNATAVTYTLGTDAVETGDLSPRLDLEVARNELHYVTRNATTGKPAWSSQVSGATIANSAGKRQIVTVSGPEIVDFLPKDDFESAWVVSSLYTLVNVSAYDTYVTDAVKQFGAFSATETAAMGNSVTTYVGTFGNYSPVTRSYPGPAITAGPGVTIPVGCKYFVTSGSMPEWNALGAIPVTLTATLVAYSNSTYPMSPLFEALLQGALGSGSGVIHSWETLFYRWLARKCSCTGWVIPYNLPSGTTIYKPWEYDFIAPPAGLAAELVAAQNWTPWEGPITIVSDDVSADNLLQKKFHLANGLTPCAAMGALARSILHDLMRGRTTIDLGAPARADYGSLVSRIRSEPKDNIVYL